MHPGSSHDTVHRSSGHTGGSSELPTFLVPGSLPHEVREHAAAHQAQVVNLVLDGLRACALRLLHKASTSPTASADGAGAGAGAGADTTSTSAATAEGADAAKVIHVARLAANVRARHQLALLHLAGLTADSRPRDVGSLYLRRHLSTPRTLHTLLRLLALPTASFVRSRALTMCQVREDGAQTSKQATNQGHDPN